MKRLLLLVWSVLLPAALFAAADIGREPRAFGRILPITVTYDGPSEIQDTDPVREPFEFVPVKITLDANAIPGFSYAEIVSNRFVVGIEYQDKNGAFYIREYPHEIATHQDGNPYWNRDGVSEIWVCLPEVANGSSAINLYYAYDVDVAPADVWSGSFGNYAEIGSHLKFEFGEIHNWKEPSPEFEAVALWQALDPDPASGYFWDMLFSTSKGPSAYVVYTEFRDIVDRSLTTNLFYDASFASTDVAVVYHGVVDMFADDFPIEDWGRTYGLKTNHFYTANFVVEAEIDGEADVSSLAFGDNLSNPYYSIFTGELKVEKLRDAVESDTEPISAIIRISLPDGVRAPADGFTIPVTAYSLTEGAWSGSTFEEVSYATIPAGESSVLVEIAPLPCSFDSDAEVEFFLDDCASISYASTTFTVYDKGASDAPQVVCRWSHGGASSAPCLSLAEALSYASYGDTITVVGDASGETVELKPGVVIAVAEGGRLPEEDKVSAPALYALSWSDGVPRIALAADEVRPESGRVAVTGGSFTVTIGNARAGLLYALVCADSISALPVATAVGWTRAEADGPLEVTADTRGASAAFARVVVTDDASVLKR